MSRVDYGQVTFTLGDEEIVLKPTPDAHLQIEERWGGILQAIEAVRGISLSACTLVVCAGTNTKGKEVKPIRDAIHNHGVPEVTVHVVEFLQLLMDPTGKISEAEPDSGE